MHWIELRSSQEVGFTRLPNVENLTPNLTPTPMNSDDKDERKSVIKTHKGNEIEHGERREHTEYASNTHR